jgi:hypothetical protein
MLARTAEFVCSTGQAPNTGSPKSSGPVASAELSWHGPGSNLEPARQIARTVVERKPADRYESFLYYYERINHCK